MLVSVGRPLAARSDSDQPVKETDGSCARALKREIPNPPYQGGKATEAIPRECPAGGGSREALAKTCFGAFGACSTSPGGISSYNRVAEKGTQRYAKQATFRIPNEKPKRHREVERASLLRAGARVTL